MDYQFMLEKYSGRSSRYPCPQCKQVNEFARYIDVDTGNYIAEYVGRCNRVAKCDYHYTPKQFFTDNPNVKPFERRATAYRTESKINTKVDLISEDIFKQTLRDFDQNNFIRYLKARFEGSKITDVICRYFIGTWFDGRTVFWQIDGCRLIRTGKLIAYNAITGKRIKSQKPSWVHAELKREKWNNFEYTEEVNKEFHLKQCFFGEHLLQSESQKPVGVVESEKTAIVASLVLPQLLWIATGGCGNLNVNKLQHAIKRRRVILFPDSSKFEYWATKVKEARKIFNIDIQMFNLFELRLNEEQKREDYDIADFILGDEKNK